MKTHTFNRKDDSTVLQRAREYLETCHWYHMFEIKDLTEWPRKTWTVHYDLVSWKGKVERWNHKKTNNLLPSR